MTNVSEWSTTAGSNNSAPPDGWPENMLPGKVNDCAREMQAALAKWYKDSSSSLLTAGTTLAYTLTTNSVHTSLSDIPLLTFRLHAANTGAVTLNVDGLGAKPMRKSGSLEDYASAELTSGQTMVVAYNSATDDFEVVGPVARGEFPVGTVMVFAQTAAPTGWVKGATHDNKALRLVTGTASSGGTTAFSTVFAARTIALANLPSTNLSLASLNGSVSTSINNGTNVVRSLTDDDFGTVGTSGGGNDAFDSCQDIDQATLSLDDGDVNFSGSIPLGGSGTAMDFAVQYVDVILATKA